MGRKESNQTNKQTGSMHEECVSVLSIAEFMEKYKEHAGLQIYDGPGSLSHDFKIWPITFQGSVPSGPILFSCEEISI